MRVRPLGKATSRTVREDQSVLFYVKCVGKTDRLGVDITACTATGGVNAVTITTNLAVDTDVDAGGLVTYATEGTIQGCVDRLNGITADVVNTRYRASGGDFRPGYAIGAGDCSGPAATNILLGDDVNGLAILADSTALTASETLSVKLGGPFGRRGTDPFLPDHFESDYTSTTAGVITPVRSQGRRREEQNSSLLQTMITSIHAGMGYAGANKTIRVYDENNNLIWEYILGAAGNVDIPANVLSEDHPIVGPMGSPLYVEASGTVAYTDGPLSVRGYTYVA